MRIAPQRYPGPRADAAQAQEPLWPLVERFYTRLGTKASAQKLTRDAAIVAQLVADGFSVEEITYAGEWAVQHIPGVTSFGLLPYIMHHALKARHEARQAEAAQHEVAARLQAHRQHQQAEQAEQARAQRLEAFRATLAAAALEALQRQAAAALAEADVGPRHVAYGLMRKLRLNDLIEEAFQRAEAEG